VAEESASLRAYRERYQRWVEIFNSGDFEGAFAGVHDDVEFHPAPNFPVGVLHGREALVSFFTELRQTMSEWRLEPHEFHEVGDERFVVGFEGFGTGRSSGVPARQRVWSVIILRDGQTWRVREFFDRDAAFAFAEEADD
jgi:ketosteroid isomerase-like protein